MRTVYVIAPDCLEFFPGRLQNHPHDGDDVRWIIPGKTHVIHTMEALVRQIAAHARTSSINVLRLLGHGGPGSLAILGKKNPEQVAFGSAESEQALQKLGGLFDRRAKHGHIYLHGCEAAADYGASVNHGRVVLGGSNQKAWGTHDRTPGFDLLWGLADITGVPVSGSLFPINATIQQWGPSGNYNWTLWQPLTVYPQHKKPTTGEDVVEYDQAKGWG
jgi:hypothetical protein